MIADFFLDAVKMGVRKTALVDIIAHCPIKASSLGRYLGSKAGAAMLLKQCQMIEF